jgi:hypothetical protein
MGAIIKDTVGGSWAFSGENSTILNFVRMQRQNFVT